MAPCDLYQRANGEASMRPTLVVIKFICFYFFYRNMRDVNLYRRECIERPARGILDILWIIAHVAQIPFHACPGHHNPIVCTIWNRGKEDGDAYRNKRITHTYGTLTDN